MCRPRSLPCLVGISTRPLFYAGGMLQVIRGTRRTLAGAALMTVLAVPLACGSDAPNGVGSPRLADPAATGRELVIEFLTILQDEDMVALDSFLDPSFQLQRADGSGATKSEYLAKPAQVQAFELGEEFRAVQSGEVLTVRWTVVIDETINGTQIRKGDAPRLSAFVWRGDRWRMLSHANFVRPAADGAAPTLADPEAAGRELVVQFIEILRAKDRDALAGFLAAPFQIQRADGTSADRDEYLAADINISSFELGPEVEAVQSGGVLTVRWSIKLVETIEGRPTGTGLAPRLSTFVWERGVWKLASHANFNRIED